MAGTIIGVIVAVVVTLLIAVPVTCKVAVDIRNPEWYDKKQKKFLHFDEKRHKTTRHYRKSIKLG